jgi:Serine/threonine protein kinase
VDSASLPPDPLVGQTIDERYTITARLARGGMASVYLATDARLDRPVALKIIHPHLADSDQFTARFRREARSAARISHKGVVPVYDQGTVDGQAYLVMEFIDGPNLRSVLTTNGPLSIGQALDFTAQILEAMASAHAQGVVHRDLKPENILVSKGNNLKVTDFGLARAASEISLSSTGSVLGTVAYLAPEVAGYGISDERTDVYAAGLMLFEMLTGTVPWEGEVPLQVAYARINEDVPPVSSIIGSLPQAVDALVMRFCARSPENRPVDAGSALKELNDVRRSLTPQELDQRFVAPARDVNHKGTQAVGVLGATTPLPVKAQVVRTSGTTSRTQVTKRRNKVPLIVLIVLLFVGAAAAGLWWWTAYGPGAYVDVPKVAGLEQEKAEEVLGEAGLEVLVSEDNSDDVAAGKVIESRPDSEERVPKNTVVTLYVSKGIKMVKVPNAVNQTQERAKTLIEKTGLSVGKVEEIWSETAPAGTVLEQNPKANASVQHDTSVTLKVSKGRQPLEVPSVVGMNREDARAAIEAAGLVVSEQEGYFDQVEVGIVATQDPAPEDGTLFRGDTVTFVVSLGPELFEVPDVVGMDVDEATRILKDAGFEVKVNRIAAFFNFVGAQDPEKGTMAKAGTLITLSAV